MKILSILACCAGTLLVTASAFAQQEYALPEDSQAILSPALMEVKNVIDRFGRMWEDEDMAEFANVIAHDANMIVIGTDQSEYWVGYDAYKDARAQQYASYENVEFNVRDQRITLSASGDVAWFSETFDLFLIAQGEPASLEGIRLTGVLEKRYGYWKIVHLHNSLPVLGQAAAY